MGEEMIERLEQQRKLTSNQWKLICTANIADLLDFFDFFLIGYVTAALTKEWSLSYGQGGAILLASGLGAVPGAFIWGWLGDKIGRRTVFLWSAVTISLATGIMVLTPGPDALIPGWLFMVFFRVFVGIGNAGIFTIDLPLVQEFIPAYKRGWVSALVTTLLPGGGMLAGLVASWLLPIIGWRYLFLVGLSPLVLVFMIRYWVPESPRWLIRMGRLEEARNSLAWALMIDPKEINLPTTLPAQEKTRWLDLFKYPKLCAAGMMTGLTQTGGASFGLWGATLLVIVLNTSPAHAAFLMVFTGVSGIAGRFFITTMIEPLGRRGAGTLACGMAGLLTVSAGYLYDVFIGGWSLFYMLMLAGTFFSSSIYTVVGPYMSEIWPARLRSSGMGMSYGVGNLGGKVLGPAGLAVIMGAGDIIKPAAPNLAMLGPAFLYFACWYVIGIIGFWAFGPETKGRTFEEMDEAHDAPRQRVTVSARAPAE
jgi:putative MFS transporter